MSTVAEAYRACADITRTEARNFHYGIRLLPEDKRAALCALYALARCIDDIGDGDLPPEQKTTQLADLRRSIEDLGSATDPVLVAVGDTCRRYPVPVTGFLELVDGVQMDLEGVTYRDFEELVVYCRRVAGAVGRLCLSVFGSRPDPRAAEYADQLGIALQQTNILRDVREDLLLGRVYLPQDELDAFGVDLRVGPDGQLEDPDARLAALLRFSAARAENWYVLGLRLVPLLDRRSAACCLAMAGIYRELLGRIAANPPSVYDHRLSLPTRRKAGVALTALAQVVR
jgi:phytoene synthase